MTSSPFQSEEALPPSLPENTGDIFSQSENLQPTAPTFMLMTLLLTLLLFC